ncbi:MAG: hypothetical protein ACRCTE_11485, partial [Cellulosilyticaceae bacterium]
EEEVATAIEIEQGIASKKVKKMGPGKIAGISIGAVLGIFLLLGVGLLIYVNAASYDIPRNKIDVKEYLDENKDELFTLIGNEIELTVPEELLNAYLKQYSEQVQQQVNQDFKIEGACVAIGEEKLLINGKWKAIKLPIGIYYTLDMEGSNPNISIDSVKLGKANLPVPKFFVKGILGVDTLEVPIAEILPPFIEITEIKDKKDAYRIEIQVGYEALKQEIMNYRNMVDNDMTAIYRQMNDDTSNLIGILLGEGIDITESDMDALLKVKLNDQTITLLLAALNEQGVQKFEESYGKYLGEPIAKEQIAAQKEEIKIQGIVQQAQGVFDAIDTYVDYAYSYPVNNMGFLYNPDTRKKITVETLINEGYLGQNMGHFKQSYLLYDEIQDYSLLYCDGDTRLKITPDGIATEVDETVVKAIQSDDALSAALVTRDNSERKAILDGIRAYNSSSDQYFVRFMKSDTKHAFAIVSTTQYFQDIEQYVLEKGASGWQVKAYYGEYQYVMNDITSYYPEVNLDILPNDEVASFSLNYLSDSDFDILKNHIYYSSNMTTDEIQFDYASMCNNVVYMQLTNGRKYIYYNDTRTVEEVTEASQIEYAINRANGAAFIFLQD